MNRGTLTKGERTRGRILDAAVQAFGTKGFRSTSVATIARDAGVSPAAVFTYWPSKEALFDAAVDRDAHAVIDELLHELGETADIGSWLALVRDLLRALDRHPLARRVLAGHEPEVIDRVLELPAFEDLRALLASVIAAGQQAGTVRRDIDPFLGAVGVETITLALAMALLQLGEEPDPVRELGVAEVLLSAFRPPA